ncbi:hypothetical protein HanRHA438_Chr03g0108071 [Helianthus annuus]|uniref:Uncharacterized protein n=1 Tax=Helianthus annuus TaxID=4232 RepID=A0A251UUE1_HELAN|nr:hypothetical protein HanXRQr2_Chr03g0097001 [Helianthus annuus]KAJ0599521.1 hypothetical protein HanIR_Chr03g0105801 [Helianthus annuus]KAJ0607076.1 hypothetical protein HanHA89_Chr03g0092331 [Helianthus annuus]KAJ0772983.1 hypothetical protein HanOQP8_Chr03g0093671 [Helianthus annuus]KAJ0934496.1 hypothetical protein HanRHA438_Chr03g0108071 [Helianthus annuus]
MVTRFLQLLQMVFVSYVIRQPLLVMMVESGTSKAFMIKGLVASVSLHRRFAVCLMLFC